MSEGRESYAPPVVGIIRPVPAFGPAMNGFLHRPRASWHVPEDAGTRGPPLYAALDGAPDALRAPAGVGNPGAVLDRVRERRLLDLLRAGPGGVVRARPNPDRISAHGRDLLSDGCHICRGDRDVPGGGGLVELCSTRVQRAVVVFR